MTTNGDYHVLISVKDAKFNRVDEKTFSGKNAIVDAIFYLDEKYSPPPIEILKRCL
jgi:hypothetical protein